MTFLLQKNLWRRKQPRRRRLKVWSTFCSLKSLKIWTFCGKHRILLYQKSPLTAFSWRVSTNIFWEPEYFLIKAKLIYFLLSQMSCRTSSASLWMKTRPLFRSMPSHHYRYDTPVGVDHYCFDHPVMVTESRHSLCCRNTAAACPPPAGNPGQQGMMGDFKDGFYIFHNWLSSQTKYMQSVEFLYHFFNILLYFYVLKNCVFEKIWSV